MRRMSRDDVYGATTDHHGQWFCYLKLVDFPPGGSRGTSRRGPWPSDGAGQRLDRHPQTAEHLQVGLGGPPEGGEVVADDDGVDAGWRRYSRPVPLLPRCSRVTSL